MVLMDNLAAHKSARVEEVIRARGCQLLFLPSYSPDFSPIEEAFSKLKTDLSSGWSPHTRSATRSHCSSIADSNRPGCARVVSA